jgi:hypothetical protein
VQHTGGYPHSDGYLRLVGSVVKGSGKGIGHGCRLLVKNPAAKKAQAELPEPISSQSNFGPPL